jgi:hypothetical protein
VAYLGGQVRIPADADLNESTIETKRRASPACLLNQQLMSLVVKRAHATEAKISVYARNVNSPFVTF